MSGPLFATEAPHVQRIIDGPETEYLTTADALKWLGIGRDLFVAEAAAQSAWLRPKYFGSRKYWYWLDIYTLSNIMRLRDRRPGEGPAAAGD